MSAARKPRAGAEAARASDRPREVAPRRAQASSASALEPRRASKAGARIEEHRLENGLRVLVAERHLDPVVAVMVFYGCGARDERDEEAGVAHFLEHMMFKGSTRFAKGEIDRLTTVLGGNNNAFTTADHTAYWFELASDRWEKALEIEADRMRGLLLEPSEFEAEKSVVLEELAMGEDDPWRALTQEVQLALFPRHPYRRPVIGWSETLRALGVEGMRAWYRRHYRPDNAILVVCGDVTPEQALERVRHHFGALAAEPLERPASPAAHAPTLEPRGERRVTIRWDDSAHRLVLAWPTVRVGTDEDWALDLVSAVLAGGRSSRLYRRIVLEQGLATSISAHNEAQVDPGAFWIFAEAAHGISLERLEAAVEREIARVAAELVPAAELARARKMLLASEAYEGETVSDLAEDLGEFAVDADWTLTVESARRIQAVKASGVRAAAARLLVPERRVVGWCVPRAAEGASAAAGVSPKSPGRAKAKRATRKARSASKASGAKRKVRARSSASATKRKRSGQSER